MGDPTGASGLWPWPSLALATVVIWQASSCFFPSLPLFQSLKNIHSSFLL